MEDMTPEAGSLTARNLTDRILRGEDGKIRSLWRVLLGLPVYFLLFLITVVLFSLVDIQSEILSAFAPLLIHACLFTAAFVFIWARRLDDIPLHSYGIPAIGGFLTQIAAGFVITFLGFGIWYGVLVAGGWIQFRVVLEYPGGSLVLATVVGVLATLAGTWAQQLLYLGIIFRNAADGLASRLDNPTTAIAGGVGLTTVIFLGRHFIQNVGAPSFLPPVEAAIFLTVGIGLFFAIYFRTGSLPMAAGAHGAVNIVPGLILARAPMRDATSFPPPRLFAVDGTSPLPELVSVSPVVEVLLAYGLLRGIESTGVTLATSMNAIDSIVNSAE